MSDLLVEKTPSIDAREFARDFLRSPRVQTSRATSSQLAYVSALADLCLKDFEVLAVTRTSWTQRSTDTHAVWYDVKCRAAFEDAVVERLQKAWSATPVCPFRRGLCVGLLTRNNRSSLALCVGNVKFYDGIESEILGVSPAEERRVVLSEKANGEYTLLSMVQSPDSDNPEDAYLIVGSKNVRVILPYDSNPRAFLSEFVRASGDALRFSYVSDMLGLWLSALKTRPDLSSKLLQGTLVGEQVGVHTHIHAGYTHPHVKLFAYLAFADLLVRGGCDVLETRRELEGLPFVGLTSYELPRQREDLARALRVVATGKMEEQGEGVVAYVYAAGGELRLYKYKNEEYAFDRRLRTLLTPVAQELHQHGMTIARLHEVTAKIVHAMTHSATNVFTQLDPARVQQRLAMIPALVAFLERHQSTVYCRDFSECFTELLASTEAKQEAYYRLSDRFREAQDEMLETWRASVTQCRTLLSPTPLRSETRARFKAPEALAQELYRAWSDAGGAATYPVIGLAASPGGGKTTILKHLAQIFEANGVPVGLFDRDAVVIQSGPSARPDFVHRTWLKRIAEAVTSGRVALVGNTFTGTMADKLSSQLELPVAPKVFLGALAEHTIPVGQKRLSFVRAQPAAVGLGEDEDDDKARALCFHVECWERLLRRTEPGSDGSTLILSVGGSVVLQKYFSSQPDEAMLKRRLKERSAVKLRAVESVSGLTRATALQLLQVVVELRAAVIDSTRVVKQGVKKLKLEDGPSESASADQLGAKLKVSRNAPSEPWALASWTGRAAAIRFVALEPSPETERVLCGLADPDVVRTNGHITVVFGPTQADLERIQASLASLSAAAVPLDALVTVLDSAQRFKLQFLTSSASLLPGAPHAHVTLGSTNINVLPHSLSGSIHRAMQPELANQILQLENQTYYVSRQALPTPATFRGALRVVPHLVRPPDATSVR